MHSNDITKAHRLIARHASIQHSIMKLGKRHKDEHLYICESSFSFTYAKYIDIDPTLLNKAVKSILLEERAEIEHQLNEMNVIL